jgi:trehalose 6-phosphate synthase/phosphatase
VLPGALLVNPWDPEDLAARLVEALALDGPERRRRLELMAERVAELDCKRWAAGFVAKLDRYALAPALTSARPLSKGDRERIALKLEHASTRTLVLDYDGTLRELMSHPDLAVPSAEIRELLAELARLPGTDVHLISGRSQETLEAWFGDLPIHLGAEYGYLSRGPGAAWRTTAKADLSWLPRIQHLFDLLAADVPGTVVERKRATVAWHYRQAEPKYGSWRARELLVALDEALAGFPAEVLPGHGVIEVRPRGVNKGVYLRELLRSQPGAIPLILAAGDDRTDIELFRALPRGSIALHVGRQRAGAHNALLSDQYSLDSPRALRSVLKAFAEQLAVALAHPAQAGATGTNGAVAFSVAARA